MNNADFTRGKIVLPLVRFVFPILFAMLIQSLYGAADLLVVGRFSDAAGVSAVSVGSQVMMSVTMVVSQLSAGSSILLGQAVGSGKKGNCGPIVGATVFFFTLLGLVLSVLIQPLARPMTAALNAPVEATAQTVAYIRICGAGAVFIVAYNLLGSIFRGIGDAKMPLVAVLIAAVFNVFGDLFFVAVLGMGAAGAAVATVLAQAFSVILSLLIIRRRGLPFDFTPAHVAPGRRILLRILRLGLPLALQDLLVSLSFLIILAIVNRLGVVASAGTGVAEKLCGFIMLLPSAFSQAMSSFVAQNYGAGRMDRAEKALRCGIGISFACSLVLGYAAFFHGAALSSLFSKDPAICHASAEYLKAYGIDCLLTSFLFCLIGFLSGCSRTRFVMLQGIAGAFGVRVPLSLLFSRVQPVSLFRIGLATPCSSAVQILLCLVCLLHIRRQLAAQASNP